MPYLTGREHFSTVSHHSRYMQLFLYVSTVMSVIAFGIASYGFIVSLDFYPQRSLSGWAIVAGLLLLWWFILLRGYLRLNFFKQLEIYRLTRTKEETYKIEAKTGIYSKELYFPLSIVLLIKRTFLFSGVGLFLFFFFLMDFLHIIPNIIQPLSQAILKVIQKLGTEQKNLLFSDLLPFLIVIFIIAIIVIIVIPGFVIQDTVKITDEYIQSGDEKISWHEISSFVTYTVPTFFLERRVIVWYEIASSNKKVSWRWIPNPQSAIMIWKPTTSMEEYHQQMQALRNLITARTGLPLYNLTPEEEA